MPASRLRHISAFAIVTTAVFVVGLFPLSVWAKAPVLRVAYAGSMGVVIDTQLGPAFCRKVGCSFEGIGRGSWGLAHLLASGTLRADVFISVTRGPMRYLERRKSVRSVIPIARTRMVIAYNASGRFGRLFKRAKDGRLAWWRVLEKPGMRIGRTDPRTDPQGRNVIFTLLLAERADHQPNLAHRLLGTWENPMQIFSEPSLMSRLESGEIDAAITYETAAASRHIPYLILPPQVNLGEPGLRSWYQTVGFHLMPRGPLLHPTPLVFYAGILAPASPLASTFVRSLSSTEVTTVWHGLGYLPMPVDRIARRR